MNEKRIPAVEGSGHLQVTNPVTGKPLGRAAGIHRVSSPTVPLDLTEEMLLATQIAADRALRLSVQQAEQAWGASWESAEATATGIVLKREFLIATLSSLEQLCADRVRELRTAGPPAYRSF